MPRLCTDGSEELIVCNNKQASEEFPSGACVFFRGCRSFLTKKMGGGSVCLLETVARAGSLAGTYAWSVWLLSPAGHLWAGCSAQLAGWLIAAAFRRKVVRSKTISPAKRFRPSCSGRMAHSCPAYDTDRTPILEIWQIFRSSIMEAVSFCAQISLSHGPDIGSRMGAGPSNRFRQR